MNKPVMASGFSICFLLDHKSAQAVDAVRQTLPASPHRDNTPHVTLLRTIKPPSQMSDADLLQDMERLLELSKKLPLDATVKKPTTIFSPLFGHTSLVLLRAPSEMKSCRKDLMKTLLANNYSIGLRERLVFVPHFSIRLGVPYTKASKSMTEQSFSSGTKLTFKKWVILRDVKKDEKYLVHEITLNR